MCVNVGVDITTICYNIMLEKVLHCAIFSNASMYTLLCCTVKRMPPIMLKTVLVQCILWKDPGGLCMCVCAGVCPLHVPVKQCF